MSKYKIELKSVTGEIVTVIEECTSFTDAGNKCFPNVFCHNYEIISITKINQQ